MVQEQSPSPTLPAALEGPVSVGDNDAVIVGSEIIASTTRRTGRKVRRKGSVPSHHSVRLDWSTVKAIVFAVEVMRMNCSIDIMPAEGSDRERKAFIQNYVRVLSQALKRKTGRALDFVLVFEKEADIDLHAHMICWIPDEHCDLVEKRHDGVITVVRHLATARDRESKANYITKQRNTYSPDFERRVHHRYKLGAKPIPGRKVSMSRSVKEAIDRRSAER